MLATNVVVDGLGRRDQQSHRFLEFCVARAAQFWGDLLDIAVSFCRYRPPSLWGRSGHVQTIIYGLLGHATLRRVFDRRAAVRLSDGSTVTFDVFEPINKHKSGLDLTLALTPGIANSSESNYIRTCVHYAQERGYRCAVLNHLGALADVKLTGNRIFSYGEPSFREEKLLLFFKSEYIEILTKLNKRKYVE
ncbi:unnamed protein product [Nippostrongylus brasiliensis]|uniref:Alpha/beta hydrolase2 (inferred by orthology to a D. melanogaster protein) n=1 Tax=Nippostrongylus brasiliensis TaxID=27835 RepID=A0A0N4YYD3_NIPBR|nr:unnamed protein product [Nippostrongylus brasiliensis]